MKNFSLATFAFLSLTFVTGNLYAFKLPDVKKVPADHPMHTPGHPLHEALSRIEKETGGTLDASGLDANQAAVLENLSVRQRDPKQLQDEVAKYLRDVTKIKALQTYLKSYKPVTATGLAGMAPKTTAAGGKAAAGAGTAALPGAFARPEPKGGKKEEHAAPERAAGELPGVQVIGKEAFQTLFKEGKKEDVILSQEDAAKVHEELFGANGTLKDMPPEQVALALSLLKAKKLRGEVLDAAAVKEEMATVHGEGLGAAEVRKLEEIRKAIDDDDIIQATVDAALAGKTTPAAKAEALKALITKNGEATLKELQPGSPEHAEFQRKLDNAKSLADVYASKPTAENFKKLREAAEEMVATQDDRYKDICGPCNCR